MFPRVMLLMALCGLFLKNQMQGALGQESTTKSFWKDLDQELEAIQAAKAAAGTDPLSTGTGIQKKPANNPTSNMPADDEEWKFILCTTLMTTATLGSKEPDQAVIVLINRLCPKLEGKLNKTLSDPAVNGTSTSLDKLLYKLQGKITIKENPPSSIPKVPTKNPGKPSGEIITPKPSAKPNRKTRGVRRGRSAEPNNDEFKNQCEVNVTNAKEFFKKQIDGIKTKFNDSMKSFAFFAQRKSDFHGDKSAFVNFTTPEILYSNKDNNFNYNAGQFTAPVHGQYYLKFQGLKIKQELSQTYTMTAKIVKKDGGNFKTLAVGHIYIYDYYSYFPIYVQATVVLKEGDVVGVMLGEGWLHEFGNDEERFSTSFTGFLIKEINPPKLASMPQKGCSPCASRT